MPPRKKLTPEERAARRRASARKSREKRQKELKAIQAKGEKKITEEKKKCAKNIKDLQSIHGLRRTKNLNIRLRK